MNFEKYVKEKVLLYTTIKKCSSVILDDEGTIIEDDKNSEEIDKDWMYECQICDEEIEYDIMDNRRLDQKLRDHFEEKHKDD